MIGPGWRVSDGVCRRGRIGRQPPRRRRSKIIRGTPPIKPFPRETWFQLPSASAWILLPRPPAPRETTTTTDERPVTDSLADARLYSFFFFFFAFRRLHLFRDFDTTAVVYTRWEPITGRPSTASVCSCISRCRVTRFFPPPPIDFAPLLPPFLYLRINFGFGDQPVFETEGREEFGRGWKSKLRRLLVFCSRILGIRIFRSNLRVMRDWVFGIRLFLALVDLEMMKKIHGEKRNEKIW